MRTASALVTLIVLTNLTLLVPAPGAAQSFTAGIRGAVLDSGGTVVPGVTVQLINEATGGARETVSNTSGEYDFSALPPATYTIRAALTGFRTTT